ncbi:glutamate synthase large subunit [Natronomonas pharaonis DSM 2160]|uniref:Glutamate synthase large subunit n=1 Tax=Natronomonas pharaonis (strain ATCC 35678 / DSM 2160 / CIP 103997 / JCM 8858 / NBRC 14720 / NCIMB 2260 / Gabara) TaxID=348780 RepID=A0A1U7EVD1_NATPD|nr:glutamate synthase large subunit [Natronomonas pharaonis]CAI48988.1 glutamate synthase large subunit [Natronomonas pharaonis DSM 2160]
MSEQTPTAGTAGLADPDDHRANCGVGVVMDLDGDQSHETVADGIELLENLEHRGTTGADEKTGDGAGILLQTPHEFFADEVAGLPDEGDYAVGSLFMPQDEEAAAGLQQLTEQVFAEHGLDVFAWRRVPTENDSLGRTATESEPAVVQCFVTADLDDEAFDRALYVARRDLETTIEERDPDGAARFYVCSLDRDTVVYKGLLTAEQLADYYPELSDERIQSTFAMVHARFSTNTLGAWHLSHPYRNIIHNGEFNTIQGNINWMRARENDLEHEDFGGDIETLRPIINDPDQSDTASVDNALELLMQGGREMPHALRMLIPEAWRSDENHVPEERQEWYDYHASLVEPWDGPALVAATDGERVGAVLDRNGLRPCRYDVTSDNTLVMASEAGALEHDFGDIERRDRLQPGQLFLADPNEGRVIPDDEIFDELVDEKYGEWVDDEQVELGDIIEDDAPEAHGTDVDAPLRSQQALYGYTRDEMDHLIEPMATDGKDPVGSMGDDTPLSVLSQFNRPLFSYFKQLFAQVTNPPLDYIREELVTSLESRLGFQRNLLDETPDHARQLVVDSPVLTDDETAAIKDLDDDISTYVLDITFDPGSDLEAAVEAVREEATRAAHDHDIIVLSDREAGPDAVPIPALLATGGIHHHLVRNGLRNHVGLVLESGDPRAVHHVATCIGYGAGAVNPYLAYESIADIVAGPDGADESKAIEAYIKAVEDGLLKTMAKMGISTVESYQGAQIFEAVGLDSDFVAEYFEGTTARTEGVDIDDIESDLRDRYEIAFGDDPELEHQGEYEHRSSGMFHEWNPESVGTLQKAVRQGDYEQYQAFAEMMNDQQENLQTLRGLLEFDSDRDPVDIEDVEPVEEIVERFSTAAMSLGSLSPEAHENNSIAMNRLGAKSNTGEGGEPPERFDTEKECNVKQVASGRFGVTSTYLTNAEEIQIKMAQGSKPGEGGHLPGEKVNEMIAHVRYSTPGVGLISPPPLHDIYSIEDLKQLIHDLKAANPDADINVKLVSEAGIGTIAAGVAKANADVVHISGHSGGTGASPKTSIKNAGLPWELGLAEANQMLRATDLRSRIRVTVDGGMKTGYDVAVGALLGAEEYVFGTAPLVTSGCVMARQCHENTCPVGVATQDEGLRQRFPGEPQHVINYMTFIAQELREIMAELGFETVDEMVGRVDALKQRDDVEQEKAQKLDLSAVLAEPAGNDRRKTEPQPHEVDESLDWDLIDEAAEAIESGRPTHLDRDISNVDRAVGATLSNRISEAHGVEGLPEDTVTVDFGGTAGQSFGAFLQDGVTFQLTGTGNDYVGKGLSGGKLVVNTPNDAPYEPEKNILIGNVALYGATQGQAYINGMAGERFAVRNSGVKAVVESVGDHGCEYMTGGVVACLGETGKNFAAGMSGGVAYVLDREGDFEEKVNYGMVSTTDELDENDRRMLRRLLENHVAYTDSDRGEYILDNWDEELEKFVKVMPDAYADIIDEQEDADVRTELPAPATPETDTETTGQALSDD